MGTVLGILFHQRSLHLGIHDFISYNLLVSLSASDQRQHLLAGDFRLVHHDIRSTQLDPQERLEIQRLRSRDTGKVRHGPPRLQRRPDRDAKLAQLPSQADQNRRASAGNYVHC